MSCDKGSSSRSFRPWLITVRNAFHQIGHLNEPSPPYECIEYDDILKTCVSEKTCPFVDVFRFMWANVLQTAVAVATIMFSVVVIAFQSLQFVVASRPLRAVCKTRDKAKLFLQSLVLFVFVVFALQAIYSPAYGVFVLIMDLTPWSLVVVQAVVLIIVARFLWRGNDHAHVNRIM
jgi:hypothetical protein